MSIDRGMDKDVVCVCVYILLPWWLRFFRGEESVCNAGDPGLTSGLGRPLGSLGMATHSSILAWRIPWTEEPGWLQSMGSQSLGTTEQIYIQQNDFWVVIVLKNPLAEAGDMRDVGSSPGWGRSLEGHGNTLQ